VPVVVARDAAGNESVASFPYRLFPKIFRDATIELDDGFLGRVVPAILAHTPEVKSQGDLLKDFLEINGRLRRENAAALVELAGRSKEQFLWHGPFTQLGGSQVMASFADRRSYRYQGRIVDHQNHLGFDLAVTANFPVAAGNDGIVMLARWFGIYGNTVVLDHGFGLMSLYAHLSSIDVKEGQEVKRGAPLGRSGTTGLAGGDHLHFSILVDGIPVDPREWWDAHWIRDRIEPKTGPRL
jgi:murein DD-endopeptidase MepM/ murein hydrolase activator NlpD